MSGRLVGLRVALSVAVALLVVAGAGVTACYDLPAPDCGFVCGPDDACPDDYTCANDHRCHRNGAPANLMCAPVDAAIDGAPDTAP